MKDFLNETCTILFESESFFKKVNIRIIQCDMKVRKDDLITDDKQMKDYINHLTITGRGGTDFRPAFEYVNDLIEKGAFTSLKGLIYFTDGGENTRRKTAIRDSFYFPEGRLCGFGRAGMGNQIRDIGADYEH